MRLCFKLITKIVADLLLLPVQFVLFIQVLGCDVYCLFDKSFNLNEAVLAQLSFAFESQLVYLQKHRNQWLQDILQFYRINLFDFSVFDLFFENAFDL
jgi:hypothetical protein